MTSVLCIRFDESMRQAFSRRVHPDLIASTADITNDELVLQKLAAYALVQLLAEERGIATPVQIGKTDEGQPYLDGSPAHISVSHTKGFAAAALSDHPVGVDCEFVTRRVQFESVSRRVMTDGEYDRYRSLTGEKQRDFFFEVWTGKESWMKYTGRRMAAGFSFDTLQEHAGVTITHRRFDDVQTAVCCKKDEVPTMLLIGGSEFL